ncbi:hypothetical protein JRQ81_005489 [Phrynocephalus forsythii]|uniref:Uncharacterized protein n=1 Tax=Phrynocephalus forsythii TaxID=171643 RepID=A0A9Q0XGP1_9SAUR|nr:hypothetical protein JRQ81_005489 [Phrynocephalus forsythii]
MTRYDPINEPATHNPSDNGFDIGEMSSMPAASSKEHCPPTGPKRLPCLILQTVPQLLKELVTHNSPYNGPRQPPPPLRQSIALTPVSHALYHPEHAVTSSSITLIHPNALNCHPCCDEDSKREHQMRDQQHPRPASAMSGSPGHGEAPAEGDGTPAAPAEELPCAELKDASDKCIKEKGEDACKELLEAYLSCLRALGTAHPDLEARSSTSSH